MATKLIKNLFHKSQMVFPFIRPSEVSKLTKRSNAAVAKRRKNNAEKDLYQWLEMDCLDLPSDIEFQLDELILQRKLAIRNKWTIAEEANRKGMDTSDLSRLSMSNGLLCNPIEF